MPADLGALESLWPLKCLPPITVADVILLKMQQFLIEAAPGKLTGLLSCIDMCTRLPGRLLYLAAFAAAAATAMLTTAATLERLSVFLIPDHTSHSQPHK